MKNDKFRAFMLIFKVGLIGVAVLAGGYVFVDVMMIAKPTPKKAPGAALETAKTGKATPAAPTPSGESAPTGATTMPAQKGPTPFTAINQALAMPGQMVGQARAVVGKSDERTEVLDKVIVESESPAHANVPTKESAALGDISKTASVVPAEKSDEELAAQNPRIVATPDASAAFRAWVGKSHITSVVKGNPPSIMINNVLVRGGQEANAPLGIIFDGLDPANKKIVFRDKSGAMVLLTH